MTSPGVRIATTELDHDELVKDAIARAQAICGTRRLPVGIGVLEYRDYTVVVISETLPDHTVFVADKRGVDAPVIR